jgi:hypothetical protein
MATEATVAALLTPQSQISSFSPAVLVAVWIRVPGEPLAVMLMSTPSVLSDRNSLVIGLIVILLL